MPHIIAALLAVACCASIAQAQSTVPAVAGTAFTLEKALSAARSASPSIEAASAALRSATAARTVAGLGPNPSIVAQTENVAGSGQYRGTRSAETTAGVELPVELGGKRSARIAVADARSNRVQVAAAIAEADLRLAVTQSYIEAVAAERRLFTAREQAGLAAGGLRTAEVRVRAGRASPIEEQRAGMLLINAEAAVERGIRNLDLARANLARRIGASISGALDLAWFDRIGAYGPAPDTDARSTLAMVAARADLTTAEAQIRLAQSQRVPDIRLSASARRLAATNDTAAVFGVAIPFPLFNNGSAVVAQARAERDQSEAQRRMVELDIEQAIAGARADVANAAGTARTASGPALAVATESARIARIGYREGKFGQLELLDAERTLLDIRAAAIDALAAFHDAQARLDRLTTSAPTFTKD